MKEYLVISKVDPDVFENALNKAAKEGFTIEQFKPVCTASGVVFHIAIMSRDQEVQAQKQRVKDFLDSYGNYVEKAITGDLTDEELEELNEEVLGRIKSIYGDYDK